MEQFIITTADVGFNYHKFCGFFFVADTRETLDDQKLDGTSFFYPKADELAVVQDDCTVYVTRLCAAHSLGIVKPIINQVSFYLGYKDELNNDTEIILCGGLVLGLS